MRIRCLAAIAGLTCLVVVVPAQSVQSQEARARDRAAKAYMAAHREAKVLPNRVLVRFSPNANPSERAAARSQAKGLLIRKYRIVPGLELIDSPLGAERAMEILGKNPHVMSVEPDRVLRIATVPDDPLFNVLWGLDQSNDFDINAPEAWDTFTGDANFLVGSVDTGINYNHPDLIDNVWTNPGEIPGNGIDDEDNGFVDDVHGYDFVNDDPDPNDDHRHGSHTSGTIGARGNNAIG